jgi:hypothetical protein
MIAKTGKSHIHRLLSRVNLENVSQNLSNHFSSDVTEYLAVAFGFSKATKRGISITLKKYAKITDIPVNNPKVRVHEISEKIKDAKPAKVVSEVKKQGRSISLYVAVSAGPGLPLKFAFCCA